MVSDTFLIITVIAAISLILMFYFFKKSEYPEMLNRYLVIVGLGYLFTTILEAMGKLDDFYSFSLPFAEMILIWGIFLLILYFAIKGGKD